MEFRQHVRLVQEIRKPGGARLICEGSSHLKDSSDTLFQPGRGSGGGSPQTFHVKRLRARLGSVPSALTGANTRGSSIRERRIGLARHQTHRSPRTPAGVLRGQDSPRKRPSGREGPPSPRPAHEPQRWREERAHSHPVACLQPPRCLPAATLPTSTPFSF